MCFCGKGGYWQGPGGIHKAGRAPSKDGAVPLHPSGLQLQLQALSGRTHRFSGASAEGSRRVILTGVCMVTGATGTWPATCCSWLWPSCPMLPSPQVKSEPSEASAMEWAAPAATDTMR